jgi:putative membrane protein
VLILSGVHGFFSRLVKDFAADRNTRSPKFYRIINEIPTVLMILIVILVIVKPF